MARVEVEVKNLDRLGKKFRALSNAMKADALAGAAEIGAEVILAESKRIVPVRTGNLRASLTHETVERTADRATVAIGYGSQAPYGRFVELGTSRMSAQPFLRPAMISQRALAVRQIRDALKRLIDRARD